MPLSSISSVVFVCGILAANVYGEAVHLRTKRAACEQAYYEISPQHSMCLTDKGSEVVLSAAEQQAIVDQHNQLRAVQGNGQPQATNMQKIVWDDEIAKVASKWVRQCGSRQTAHEAKSIFRSVKTLPGVLIGQNAANGFATFDEAIQAWYDEVSDFRYGVGATRSGAVIGHYTQVVKANVARIGCGKAICNSKPYYVCDYANGQMLEDMKTPYETGTSDQCPNHRDQSRTLCDCNGLICLNGGTIDLQTCTCTCAGLYKGPKCDQLNCPAEDSQFCRTQWPPEYCTQFSNVPTDCPYMCGLCKTGRCNKKCRNGGKTDSSSGKCRCDCPEQYSGDLCEVANPTTRAITCKNGGTLSKSGCKCVCPNRYAGITCSFDKCAQPQKQFCHYLQVQPSQCNDALKSICPRKCGLCSGAVQRCPLVCKNNGRLDPSTCRCRCPRGYWGPVCQMSMYG